MYNLILKSKNSKLEHKLELAISKLEKNNEETRNLTLKKQEMAAL